MDAVVGYPDILKSLLPTSRLKLVSPKAPEELLGIMKDLQSCVDKAQERKAKKKKKPSELEL